MIKKLEEYRGVILFSLILLVMMNFYSCRVKEINENLRTETPVSNIESR